MSNLGEKIFVSIYAVPRYKQEICKLLYDESGDSQHISGGPQINREMNKLVEKKWIKKLTDKEIEEEYPDLHKIGDKRAKQRQYYIANRDKLFEIISFELKKHNILTAEEEKTLKKFLNEYWIYRFYCYDSFVLKKNNITGGLELILDLISWECIQRLRLDALSKNLHYLAKDSQKDIQDYEIWRKKISIFSGNLPDCPLDESLMKKLCNISSNVITMLPPDAALPDAAAYIQDKMLLLNEYKERNKKPVLTYSRAYPDFWELPNKMKKRNPAVQLNKNRRIKQT